MTLSFGLVLRGVALVALLAAWAILAHHGSAGGGDDNLSTALGVTPLVVIVILLLWRVRNPLWLTMGGLSLMAVLAAAWTGLRENIALLYLVQHVGTNLALAALFGRTLFGEGEALVTQFARAVHGELSARKIRYTRGVTIAWTAFFIGISLVSLALYAFATAHAWSTFANLLSSPMLATMFVGEYICRQIMLPPEERTSIADTIRAYRLTMDRRQQPGQGSSLADPS